MFAINKETYQDHPRPTVDTGPGLTKKSMQAETDINLIMAKYQRTGVVSYVANRMPEFMEVSSNDLQTALNTVLQSQALFDDMPSSMRKRFNNSPAEFLDFVHNPDNLDEMIELGLADRPPEPVPPTAAPEPEPAPAPAP